MYVAYQQEDPEKLYLVLINILYSGSFTRSFNHVSTTSLSASVIGTSLPNLSLNFDIISDNDVNISGVLVLPKLSLATRGR